MAILFCVLIVGELFPGLASAAAGRLPLGPSRFARPLDASRRVPLMEPRVATGPRGSLPAASDIYIGKSLIYLCLFSFGEVFFPGPGGLESLLYGALCFPTELFVGE